MAVFKEACGLVIGIAKYADSRISPLPAAVENDAKAIHGLLTDSAYCAYPPCRTRLLLNEQASAEGIRQALADLKEQCSDRSVIFIYVSAHGGRQEFGEGHVEYLLPYDIDPSTSVSVHKTAISGLEFTAAIQGLPARRRVTVLDTCHAAGIAKGGLDEDAAEKASAVDLVGMSEDYLRSLAAGGMGRVVFAACRHDESAHVRKDDENSVFTGHLLAGLRGGAPGPGGVIRVFDLFRYVQPRVSDEFPRQHPVFKAEVEEDFPIALHLGGVKQSLPEHVPPAQDGFANDVFVSYRPEEPVKSWVRKQLIPALESRGLRVYFDNRFPLGPPIITCIEEAIESSRYTMSVLSKGYDKTDDVGIANRPSFAEFEGLLSQYLEKDKRQISYLAVMRETCDPSLSIRARNWLDMRDDEEFEASIDRLAYQIRQAS